MKTMLLTFCGVLMLAAGAAGIFWFEGLKIGTYSLEIEKTGYLPQKMETISTEKDINVGDIALTKK